MFEYVLGCGENANRKGEGGYVGERNKEHDPGRTKKNGDPTKSIKRLQPTSPSEVGGSGGGGSDIIFQVPTQKTKESLPASSRLSVQRQDALLKGKQQQWEIQKSGEYLGWRPTVGTGAGNH